jgi:hypothetical protein
MKSPHTQTLLVGISNAGTKETFNNAHSHVFHGVRSRKLCSKLPSGIIAEVLHRVVTTNKHVKLLHGFMDHDGFPPSYKLGCGGG